MPALQGEACSKKMIREAEGDDEGDDDEGGNEEEAAQKDNMTPVDNKEATRWNHARLAAGGDAATFKWCTGCLQDKELDNYHKYSQNGFGRAAQGKMCKSSANCLDRQRLKKTQEDERSGGDQNNGEDYSEEKEEENDEGEVKEDGAVQKEQKKEAMRRNVARRAAGGDAVTSKWCTGCFHDQKLDAYSTTHKGSLTRRSRCKTCVASTKRQKKKTNGCESMSDTALGARARNRARHAEEGNAMTSKWCTSCSEDKELDEYGHNKRDVLGRYARCKVCISSTQKERKAEKCGGSKATRKTLDRGDEEQSEDDDGGDEQGEQSMPMFEEETQERARFT
jgi:endonuclease/exonuclease/phosphatase family metal-dependent hydrolase